MNVPTYSESGQLAREFDKHRNAATSVPVDVNPLYPTVLSGG